MHAGTKSRKRYDLSRWDELRYINARGGEIIERVQDVRSASEGGHWQISAEPWMRCTLTTPRRLGGTSKTLLAHGQLCAGFSVFVVSLRAGPLDRAHGAGDLLVFQRRTAVRAIPGEHELKSHIRVDAMPKEVSSEGGDGCVALPLADPLACQVAPVGQRMTLRTASEAW